MRRVTKCFFLLSLIVVVFTTSCDNAVDINDDYEEITIVYGLLDKSTNQHLIKVTKAFQTDGNVYLAAKNSNVSQYNPNDLEVYIEEYNNGSFIREIKLDTMLVSNKEPGDFYFPDQIIYASEPNTILNSEYTYKLKIELLQSGEVVESSTEIVNDFNIIKPRSITRFIDFSSNYSTLVEWNSAVNGKLYQLNVRYFYTDVPVVGLTSSHYIDWLMPIEISDRTNGTEKVSIEYAGLTFYDLLAAKIPLPEDGMKRYSDSVQYIFTVAHENFAIYLDVNKPSSSIVQERPSFSNISNGIGLFSSRYSKIRPFLGLTVRSLDSLYGGSKTYMLGFEDRP